MPPVIASAAFVPAVTIGSAVMSGVSAFIQNKNVADAYNTRKQQLEAQNKQKVSDITRRSNAMIGKMRAAYGYSGISGATVMAVSQAQLAADTIDVNRTDTNTYLATLAARSEAEASMQSPFLSAAMGGIQGFTAASGLQTNMMLGDLLKQPDALVPQPRSFVSAGLPGGLYI